MISPLSKHLLHFSPSTDHPQHSSPVSNRLLSIFHHHNPPTRQDLLDSHPPSLPSAPHDTISVPAFHTATMSGQGQDAARAGSATHQQPQQRQMQQQQQQRQQRQQRQQQQRRQQPQPPRHQGGVSDINPDDMSSVTLTILKGLVCRECLDRLLAGTLPEREVRALMERVQRGLDAVARNLERTDREESQTR